MVGKGGGELEREVLTDNSTHKHFFLMIGNELAISC